MTSVLLLLAGQGQRLRPLTDNLPKCLVSVRGKSLLEWQLDVMNQFKIDRKIAVTGYNRTALDRFAEIEQVINQEYATTNIAKSLKLGLDHFLNTDESRSDLIISYGDIIYSKRVFDALYGTKFDVTTVVDKDYRRLWEARMESPLQDLETLALEGDKILSIGAKPMSFNEIDGQYIGLTKLKYQSVKKLADLMEQNPDGIIDMSITPLLNYLIKKRVFDVRACIINGGWAEIDSLEDHRMIEARYQDFIV